MNKRTFAVIEQEYNVWKLAESGATFEEALEAVDQIQGGDFYVVPTEDAGQYVGQFASDVTPTYVFGKDGRAYNPIAKTMLTVYISDDFGNFKPNVPEGAEVWFYPETQKSLVGQFKMLDEAVLFAQHMPLVLVTYSPIVVEYLQMRITSSNVGWAKKYRLFHDEVAIIRVDGSDQRPYCEFSKAGEIRVLDEWGFLKSEDVRLWLEKVTFGVQMAQLPLGSADDPMPEVIEMPKSFEF
jgi:hypothetical protein